MRYRWNECTRDRRFMYQWQLLSCSWADFLSNILMLLLESLPYLSALCLLQGGAGVNSGDLGALLRLRIRGGSDTQRRWGSLQHTGSTVTSYLLSLLAWIHSKWPIMVCVSLAEKHSLSTPLPREEWWAGHHSQLCVRKYKLTRFQRVG